MSSKQEKTKEELINEIKEELREELKQELKEELKQEQENEEVVEDIIIYDNQETPNNKNNKPFLFVLLICLIIISVLLFASPTIIEKFNKEKTVNNSKEETQEEQKEDKQEPEKENNETVIPEDSPKKQQLEEIFNKLYITENELYTKNTYEVSQMSTYELVANAIRNLDSGVVVSACDLTTERKFITFSDFNKNFKNLIKNKEITIETLNSLQQGSSYPSASYEVDDVGIKLSENKEQLKFYGSCGSIYSGEGFTFKKVTDIKEDDKNAYVYVKVAFATESEDPSEVYKIDYYADYYKTTPANETLPATQEPSWNLYNTYKYTFEKHDNGYYFIKAEKI